MTQHIPSSLKQTSMADQNVTQLANKHTDQLGLIIKDEKNIKNAFLLDYIEYYLLNLLSKWRPFVQICYIFNDSWQYWK